MKHYNYIGIVIILIMPFFSFTVVTEEKIKEYAQELEKQWHEGDQDAMHHDTLHMAKYLRTIDPATVAQLQKLENVFKNLCNNKYIDFLNQPTLQNAYQEALVTYLAGMQSACYLCFAPAERIRCHAHQLVLRKLLIEEVRKNIYP